VLAGYASAPFECLRVKTCVAILITSRRVYAAVLDYDLWNSTGESSGFCAEAVYPGCDLNLQPEAVVSLRAADSRLNGLAVPEPAKAYDNTLRLAI
jgi:hypothetical protein